MLAINYNGYHDGIARTGWKMKPPATRGERGNLFSVKILTLKKSHSRNHTQEVHATGGAGKAWDCQALSLSGLLTRALGLLTNSYSNTGGRAPFIGLEPITLAISNN